MADVPILHITSWGELPPNLSGFVSRGDHIAVHVNLPGGDVECYMIGRKGVERIEIASHTFGCGCP